MKNCRGLMDAVFRHLPAVTQENHENLLTIAGVLNEILLLH
jgi:hypothetical protein